ncbi:MAG: PAS domain S-box protein [Steroidobacteraceae bacterium]|jgi:PAS domain S-box-containing protein|nr:PAS domain S-box protein [Steroidobacteraceae bacterium]
MNASLKPPGGEVAVAPDPGIAALALANWPGEVALLGTDLRVEWVNARCAARLGVAPADCVGLEWLALHPTAAVHVAEYQRAARGEGIELPPAPFAGPGRAGFGSATLQPLLRDGAVAGLLVVERELPLPAPGAKLADRREALLRAVAEASRDAIALLDARGAISFVSDAVLAMTGRAPQQYLGRSIFEFIHPDDLGEVREKMASGDVLRTPLRMRHVRYRFRHADGQWRWLESLAVNALHDPLLEAIIVDSRDVSAEVALEEALGRSRERFRLALECAQIGYYEWDVIGDTLTGLDEWCATRGVPPENGRPGHDARWETLVHPDDLGARRRSFAEHFRGETEFAEIEYRMRAGDGRWLWVFDRAQVTERTPEGRPHRVAGVCMEIDRRRQAELALRKSEFLYRTVAEFTPGFVCEISIEASGGMRLLWASEGFGQVFGVPAAEFHQRGFRAFFEPSQLEAGREMLQRLCRGEQLAEQVRVRHLDGSHRWLHLTLRPFLDHATGTAHAAIGLAHDITERKLAEDALRDSQLRLRALAENSTDWLLLVDPEHRILFVNRPIAGIPPEQLLGRSIVEFTPPHDLEGSRGFVDAALAGRDPQPQREQLLEDGRDGPRVLLLRAQPVRAGEAIVAVVLTITEITRQRRDERMLRLQARILETMSEGVVLVDSRGAICLTNPAFDELFGYRAGELAGGPIERLFRLDAAARRGADRRLRAQRAGDRAEPIELECLRRDGTAFAAACVVTPLSIDGAEHWLAVLNDVTERKLLERQILEVSNREQQRIGNDLHDGLGQELTGVALMLRGLATQVRRAHPEAIGEVDEIVGLLNQSIHNARTLARGLSPVSLERGGLVSALRTLAARTRETYGLATTLRTRLAQPLRLDEGAASHLYRIVQEALSNAMRHGRATRVRIQLSSDEAAIRLSVHDNGRGLPPESQRPSGLGLRTMRYRAHVVGGDLLVANHRLGGTIVRCVCPQGSRD